MENNNVLEQENVLEEVQEDTQNKSAQPTQEVQEDSSKSSRKKSAKSVEDEESKQLDALAKLREEERAKLEALKEREKEKTRLAVEKERARLEAELAKEIAELENQLEMAKSSSADVKIKSLSSSLPPIESQGERSIEIVDSAKPVAKPRSTKARTSTKVGESKETKKATTTKTASIELVEATSKPTPTTTKVKSTTPATKVTKKVTSPKQKVEAKEIAALNISNKEEIKLVEEKPQEIIKEQVVEKEQPKVEAVVKQLPIKKEVTEAETVQVVEEVKQQEEVKEQESLEVEIKEEVKEQEESKVEIKEEVKEQEEPKVEIKEEVKEQEEPKVQLNEEIKEPVENKLINESKEDDLKLQIEEKLHGHSQERHHLKDLLKQPEEKPESSLTLPQHQEVGIKEESKTAINSLQKLREKIAAQKRLERQLMEREATKIQQDKTLQEKFTELTRFAEEEETVSLDELENERRHVEELRRDKQELEGHIENLNEIIDKVLNLRINGINVIDPERFELTSDFIELGIDSQALNNTILEIEEELDSLSQSHETNINKLIAAEESYQQLEELYKKQEETIKNLNNQIVDLKTQIAKEKIISKEASLQIEKLQNENMRMNRDTLLNHQLYRNKKEEDAKYSIVNELDRLSDEIRKLLSNDELDKAQEKLKEKDQEIEVLKIQLESGYRKPETQAPKGEIYCPYYACPQTMFVPRNYNYVPTNYMPNVVSNDRVDLEPFMQEIKKMREEIEQLKNKPKEEIKPTSDDQTVKLLQEMRDELSKSREEIKQLSNKQQKEPETVKEVEKPKEVIQIELPIKEVEEPKESEEELRRKQIEEIEKKIAEKQIEIQKINNQYKNLSEVDIDDLDFKRKIRVIRDKKKELKERSEQEEEAYLENVQSLNSKIDFKKVDIDNINDKIFDLELNYKQNRDFSSSTKDNYERTKGKAFVELQLQQERLNELEEDLKRVESKYQTFLNSKDEEMNKLIFEEANIVDIYLEQLRQDYKNGENYRKLTGLEEEIEILENQLKQLKSLKEDLPKRSEFNNLEAQTSPTYDRNSKIENKSRSLESDIRELTKEYNSLYNQLTELKSELEKRIEYEKRTRNNDQDINDYYTCKVNLEDCLKEYQNKSEFIQNKQFALDNISQDETKRTEQLKLKAEIQDSVVHRDDLKAKIDFYKKHLIDLESKDKVKTYNAILTQMEKIRSAQKEKREKAEIIKFEVQEKTKQLEELKSENVR